MKKYFVLSLFVILTVILAMAGTGCMFSKTCMKMDMSGMDKQESPAAQGVTGTAAVKGIEYTCAMHPEIISDKPGKCPKCGMNLVEKKKP